MTTNGTAALTFAGAQQRAWAIKLAQGFNTTNVEREFCYALKELGEAFDAWRLGRPDAGEELADAAIFLLSLATMGGHDLGAEVAAKLTKVAARQYVVLPSGELVKAPGQ
jgi:NTP pyrophosphatase (non-canonical NTP hydrolase)